ncbi:hypothetical protein JCM19235_6581 [Vibrio maritimus]|uniref:Uncharacterized protein n=1 Tax=Vibrio maritimus TaxID=990268 RepID=A0A090RU19_9VIBR|nr:hypothetical protein JCM19235_6581 [Vibrio maritimus]
MAPNGAITKAALSTLASTIKRKPRVIEAPTPATKADT